MKREREDRQITPRPTAGGPNYPNQLEDIFEQYLPGCVAKEPEVLWHCAQLLQEPRLEKEALKSVLSTLLKRYDFELQIVLDLLYGMHLLYKEQQLSSFCEIDQELEAHSQMFYQILLEGRDEPKRDDSGKPDIGKILNDNFTQSDR